MSKKLSCEQIEILIGFYAEGTLHNLLRKNVEYHLKNCPECMAKYLELVNIIEQKKEPEPVNKQYEDFKYNLSAYIDNELDDDENIRIKKFAISNPQARKELENMLNFKKILHNSFEKTKNEIKCDYSKLISSKIKQELNIATIEPFYKIAGILLAMLCTICLCFIILLNFHKSIS